MLEPVYRAVSNTAVREDMWVRIPPAAPVPEFLEFVCRAMPPDFGLCADRQGLGEPYAYLLGMYLGDGLIHSDGCRAMNRVRRATLGGVKESEYPRYFFSNASSDIRAIFAWTCELLGVDWRRTTERNISVARRESVAILDSFIGPKR